MCEASTRPATTVVLCGGRLAAWRRVRALWPAGGRSRDRRQHGAESIVRAINLQPIEMTEEEQRYLITIDCRAARAAEIRSQLVEEVAGVPDLHFSELDSAFIEDAGRVEVTATVTSHKRRGFALSDRQPLQPSGWRHASGVALEPANVSPRFRKAPCCEDRQGLAPGNHSTWVSIVRP